MYFGLATFFLIFVVEILFKMLIYHPDPPRELNRYTLPFSLPSSSVVDTSFSFPSGHTARSIFLAVIVWFLISRMKIHKKLRFSVYGLIFVYTSLVIVSRVYLGAHWISDVTGGIFLGGSAAFLALALW